MAPKHMLLLLVPLAGILSARPETPTPSQQSLVTEQALALQVLSERLSSHPFVFRLLRKLGHPLPQLTDPFVLPWGKPGITPKPIALAQMEEWQRALDYLALRDALPVHAQGMIVCGCDDLRVPQGAANIFWSAPDTPRVTYAVTAGGVGWATPTDWRNRGEGAVFREEMIRQDHLLEDKVIAETKSTNSQQNFEFARETILDAELPIDSVIVVQGPMYQRRAFLTARRVLGPEIKIYSYAPYIPHLAEFTPQARARTLKDVVREVYRLRIYSGKFFETVHVPTDVLRVARAMALHLLADPSLADADRAEMVKALGEFNQALRPPFTPRFQPEQHAA